MSNVLRASLLGSIFLIFLAVLLSACTPDSAATDAGPPDAATLEPPDPYVPPAAGAPECELSADCPPGTYCDLGECFQRCNTVDPCTGELTCTPRGRCDTDAIDTDPAPDSLPHATLTANPLSVDIREDVAAVMLGVDAVPATTELAYRIDSRVSWLRPMTERGTFSGALVTTLEVDRTGLAAGEHVGTVIIHTSAGDVTVPARLTQGLTGVYDGSFEYETPRPLGKTTLRLELVEDRGFAAIRVDAVGSPLFPAIGGARVTTTATVTGGEVSGAFVQRLAPADLGASAPIVDRDLGREFSFTLIHRRAAGSKARSSSGGSGSLRRPSRLVEPSHSGDATAPCLAISSWRHLRRCRRIRRRMRRHSRSAVPPKQPQ